MANKPLKSIKFPGLSDTYTVPEVDSTLTGSGNAADAKAVGDQLGDLKSALRLYKDVPITLTDGKYVKVADGYNSPSEAWAYTNYFVDISQYSHLCMTVPVVTNITQTQVVAAVAFYASNDYDEYLDEESVLPVLGSTAGYITQIIAIPKGANYARFSTLVSIKNNFFVNARMEQTETVDNYAQLLKSTAPKVLVIHNDHEYGDGGPCWFGVMDGYTAEGITRSNGTVVYPLPNQAPLTNIEQPYEKIMTVIKSYVGKADLGYGSDNTMYSETCTNEIDCSTFVSAVLEGITYENSRYVSGNATNKLGEYIGDNVLKYSSLGVTKLYSHAMAMRFAMKKQLFLLPHHPEEAVHMLKFGDLLFQHSDGVHDDYYYGIGHVQIVIGTIPKYKKVIVAQAGGNAQKSNETSAIKTSVRTLDLDSLESGIFPVFARPNYGKNDTSDTTSNVIMQYASDGKYHINIRNGYRLQLITSIDNNGVIASTDEDDSDPPVITPTAAIVDFIPVESNGSIVYDGELTGLDGNSTPYVATLYRYDESKSFISRNGILLANQPVSQQITKDGQEKPTKYIRVTFGHTKSQDAKTLLADLDRFDAAITVSQ